MSCVTHSEPGLPMFGFEQKFWQIDRFHEKKAQTSRFTYPYAPPSLEKNAGTKVRPDQLRPPVWVRSAWIMKKTKLNEIRTFTHLKVKISVNTGPN